MSESFATLNSERCTRVVVRVPQRGAWAADVDLESDADVGRGCVIALGPTLRLQGTAVSVQSGVFGKQRRLRVVGGAGGWGQALVTKAYHNDAGVKALLIAQDAARAVGETLGQFVPARERVGADYVRDSVRVASQVLDDAIGDGVLWWVDYAGTTHAAAQRPTPAPLADGSYQVLAYDPRARMATLAFDDVAAIAIGSQLSAPTLPTPQAVHEYEIHVEPESVRVYAWCGGDARSAGRLPELWRALVERTEQDQLFGLYKYRCVRMVGDRVSLQAVRKAAGLPDIEPISQWPGAAGVHARLTPGVEVLVGFVEGDRAQPVLVHYAGKGAAGHAPVELVIGGEPALPAARQGDQVTVLIPPMAFVGTMTPPSGTPVPLTGMVSPTLQQALGIISTGSTKVRVAS